MRNLSFENNSVDNQEYQAPNLDYLIASCGMIFVIGVIQLYLNTDAESFENHDTLSFLLALKIMYPMLALGCFSYSYILPKETEKIRQKILKEIDQIGIK